MNKEELLCFEQVALIETGIARYYKGIITGEPRLSVEHLYELTARLMPDIAAGGAMTMALLPTAADANPPWPAGWNDEEFSESRFSQITYLLPFGHAFVVRYRQGYPHIDTIETQHLNSATKPCQAFEDHASPPSQPEARVRETSQIKCERHSQSRQPMSLSWLIANEYFHPEITGEPCRDCADADAKTRKGRHVSLSANIQDLTNRQKRQSTTHRARMEGYDITPAPCRDLRAQRDVRHSRNSTSRGRLEDRGAPGLPTAAFAPRREAQRQSALQPHVEEEHTSVQAGDGLEFLMRLLFAPRRGIPTRRADHEGYDPLTGHWRN